MTDVADDLALGLELADLADAITLQRYGAEDLDVATKADATPVTEADTGAERTLRERLGQARPHDAVLGEEFGADAAAGQARQWIIDPIDGTANYVRGIPVWATLLALHDGAGGRVAVVSAPALGRRWWAARDQGAFGSDRLTGRTRRLRASAVSELDAAQVSIAGVGDWAGPERERALFELAGRTWRTRGFGDFWAHMLVAEGAVDIAVDSPGVSLWDLAAPQLIVEEAGGRFSDLAGVATAQGGDALSTNGRLHEAALRLVGR